MPRARSASQAFLDKPPVVADPSGKAPLVYKRSWHDGLAFELALLQHTDAEIARVMQISTTTFKQWKEKRVSFRRSLELGRDEADAKVAAGFYKRAAGHTIVTEQLHVNPRTGEAEVFKLTKEIPPDPKASGQWLSMRQRKRWGAVQQVEHTFSQNNVELLQRMTQEEREQVRVILLAAAAREPDKPDED